MNRFRSIFLLFTLGYLVYGLLSVLDFGISWDEPFRWRSGDSKIAYYEELLSGTGEEVRKQRSSVDLYPGLYDIPLALARKHLDVSPFVLSRAWNLLWGYLALVSTILLARATIARGASNSSSALFDWLAFAPALVLVCSPEFFGHLFINPKDIPFAATYTLAIWALIKLFDELPHFSWKAWGRFSICLGLVMAIRPPGIVVFCYLGLFLCLWLLLEFKNSGAKSGMGYVSIIAIRLVSTISIAFAVVFPWWPSMHRNPFAASGEAVEKLHSFASKKPMLFGGEFYDSGGAPFQYAVWMFFAKIPEWFGLLVIVGGILALVKWSKVFKRFVERDAETWRIAIVVFAFLFPLFWVTVSRAAIHNGYRHMLYTLPAAAVFAVAVWKYFWIKLIVEKRHRVLMLSVTSLCVLFSLSFLYRLYPYQYVYYNVLAGGVAGSYGQYETEYWFTSGKEGAEALNRFMQQVAPGGTAKVYVSGPVSVVEPFADEGIVFVNRLDEADFYIGRPSNDPLLENGIQVHEVSRMGLPILTVVALKK